MTSAPRNDRSLFSVALTQSDDEFSDVLWLQPIGIDAEATKRLDRVRVHAAAVSAPALKTVK
jgi:hypothetical protein